MLLLLSSLSRVTLLHSVCWDTADTADTAVRTHFFVSSVYFHSSFSWRCISFCFLFSFFFSFLLFSCLLQPNLITLVFLGTFYLPCRQSSLLIRKSMSDMDHKSCSYLIKCCNKILFLFFCLRGNDCFLFECGGLSRACVDAA